MQIQSRRRSWVRAGEHSASSLSPLHKSRSFGSLCVLFPDGTLGVCLYLSSLRQRLSRLDTRSRKKEGQLFLHSFFGSVYLLAILCVTFTGFGTMILTWTYFSRYSLKPFMSFFFWFAFGETRSE